MRNQIFLAGFLLCLGGGFVFSSATQRTGTPPASLKKGLLAYLKLAGNNHDQSPYKRESRVHGKPFYENSEPQKSSLRFNGKDQWLEIPSDKSLSLGKGDFSISLWVHTSDSINDVLGDLLSKYDRRLRRGFRLGFLDNAVTLSHANSRQLTFGIDNDKASGWIDCGRPGNALTAWGLAEYNGKLYAGTCEPGINETGRVYRYGGNKQWEDCGNPDSSNAVLGMAVYEGDLYVGTGKYRVSGSALPESENMTPGGRIFRYEADNRWVDCGQLPGSIAIAGLVVFQKELYASSLYSPGFFRYDKKNNTWIDCGTPDDNGSKRVIGMAVYNDHLYATCYDTGKVYRYDGKSWTDCGLVGDNTQTYAFTVYEGELYVATWPSGRVFRFDGIGKWADVGRLGNELEVMGMLVHNGRFLAGTLPLAEIYSYEGDTTWKRVDQIDRTPDVKYRRAWTLAEHKGKVYCTTLPSGHIYAYEAGKNVTWDQPVPAGWHHVAAIKTTDRLQLYMDGKLVGESERFTTGDYDLENSGSLKIGFGPNDYFRGNMKELRIYNRSLTASEIKYLAESK